MKPIFIFAIAAIAATGIGAGSLTNTIELNVQQFGVGQQDIESPIDAASVDFSIEPFPNADGTALKNLVTACSFHSDESIDGDSRIICKLTDAEHNVVAEGDIELPDGYVASDTIERIEIDTFAFDNSNEVTNIHDVTLIVLGNNPTNDEEPLVDP